MTEKEYIESFGWEPEDLTEKELREVRREIRDIEKGAIILDSILFRKRILPKK